MPPPYMGAGDRKPAPASPHTDDNMTTNITMHERFWEKVEKTNSCWLWHGATCNGNGVIKNENDKVMYAHRLAWEIVNGSAPDVPLYNQGCRGVCVNPAHWSIHKPRRVKRKPEETVMIKFDWKKIAERINRIAERADDVTRTFERVTRPGNGQTIKATKV